jgi:protein involved in polysaccharide export with SLBB domain
MSPDGSRRGWCLLAGIVHRHGIERRSGQPLAAIAKSTLEVEGVMGQQLNIRLSKLVLILVCAAISGCVSMAGPGGLPTVKQEAATPTPLAAYKVEIGDTLQVRFYRNPELDQLVTVRPDGYVSLPFVDDVKVVDRTPEEIDNELTNRYRGELAVPDVSVIVTGYGAQRIYIGGEVGNVGQHPYVGGLTLYEAIDTAGGFRDTAHRKQVILIRRDANGRPVGHAFDMRQVEHGTHPGEDVPLEPLDIVYVPRSKIATVNLFVDQYVRNLLPINPSSVANSYIRSGIY